METTFKILPQHAEEILQLAHHIVARHVENGASSPLKVQHVAEINAKASAAQSKHAEGMRFLKFAQELFKERDQLMGITQPEFTPKNILFYIQSVQETLLGTAGSEDELTQWGFSGE
ncbi:MAG: hypothetical protein V4714_22810 [Bacteroidota bacterium]